MGTKRDPGKYDCHAKAELDEPMFTLLGRDPCASILVMLWIKMREEMGEEDREKLREAELLALNLERYARAKGTRLNTPKIVDAARKALRRLCCAEGIIPRE